MRKRLKRISAAAVCVCLLFANMTVLTAQEDMTGSQFLSAEATEDDFEIDEQGVLEEYTGTAREVTIPDGVKVIGSGAFALCETMESVSIPESVTWIKSHAFNGCKGLKDVWIPDSVESMGDAAFGYCENLVSIRLPDNLSAIRSNTFTGCVSLENVTMPEGLLSIGSMAFKGCKSLRELDIPINVTELSSHLFDDCTGLKQVSITPGVTYIGINTFFCCSSLESVSIPDSVTEIDHGAFAGCSSLKEVTIPSELTSLGQDVFGYCDSLKEINVSPKNTAYSSYDGCLYNKNQTMLISCPGGKESVAFPDSVEVLGTDAFRGSANLKELTVPKSVKEIDGAAISGSKSLQQLHVAPDHPYFAEYEGCLYNTDKTMFLFCPPARTEVTILDSVEQFGPRAFERCSSLKAVVLPDTIKHIGYCMFSDCMALTEIVIPAGVEYIADRAFENCTSLTEIVIPKGVSRIGSAAFMYCIGLKKVWIPETVTEIEPWVFNKCSEDMVIYGKEGSFAQKYASENGIRFSYADLLECGITITPETVEYNGKPQKPSVTVRYGNSILKEGTDYTAVYENNTEIGTARVILTGKGNYTGVAEKTFTIKKGSRKLGSAKNIKRHMEANRLH